MRHNSFKCSDCRAAMMEILCFLGIVLFLLALAWSDF